MASFLFLCSFLLKTPLSSLTASLVEGPPLEHLIQLYQHEYGPLPWDLSLCDVKMEMTTALCDNCGTNYCPVCAY